MDKTIEISFEAKRVDMSLARNVFLFVGGNVGGSALLDGWGKLGGNVGGRGFSGMTTRGILEGLRLALEQHNTISLNLQLETFLCLSK